MRCAHDAHLTVCFAQRHGARVRSGGARARALTLSAMRTERSGGGGGSVGAGAAVAAATAQRAWRSDDAVGLLGRVGPLVAREVTLALTSTLAPTLAYSLAPAPSLALGLNLATHIQVSLSLRLKLAAGQAVLLVPSLATADDSDGQQGDGGRGGEYMVRVWCDGPCTLRWLPPLRRTSMRGLWSAGDPLHGGDGASAGGLLAGPNVPSLTAQPRQPPTAPEARPLCSGPPAGPERSALAAWVPKRGRGGALVPA